MILSTKNILRGVSYGEMFTSRNVYIILTILALTGISIFFTRSFGDSSVTKWLLTTDQQEILANSKIQGTKVVGTINLPATARDAQTFYSALKTGLSLSTPIAGFGSNNSSSIVGVIGEKTPIPLSGQLTGGDSYRAGASEFGRYDKEKPMRYLLSRVELKDVPTLLYLLGTGTVDGKAVFAYTTDSEANIDPGTVPVRTQWTVCHTSSCDFNATVMGDYQALSSAISETLSGSVKKILVKSGSYVMTQPLIVGGTGVVIEGEGTGSTFIIGSPGQNMIEWNSLSGAISNLTLDALTGVAKTAFYSSGTSDISIDKVRFIGSSDFTIPVLSFVGQSPSPLLPYSSPSSAYSLYSVNSLSTGNKLTNSFIESSSSGAVVVFSFQSGAVISGNSIKGSLSYYLSKNGSITGNTFSNSQSDGISVVTPTSNLVINSNTFNNCIRDCVNIQPQKEHQLPLATVAESLSFSGNTINTAGGFGMSLSVGTGGVTPVSFSGVIINSSTFSSINKSAVYFMCNTPNSLCYWLTLSNNIAIDTNNGLNAGWDDSAFSFEDYYATNNTVQNIRNVVIGNNSISNSSARIGYGFRFQFPGLELPIYSGNTFSGFTYGEKNF